MNEAENIRNEAWFNVLSDKLGSTQLSHAVAKIESLERLATAKGADTERLDWLEKNAADLNHCTWINNNRGRIFNFRLGATIGECATTLREAIDFARATAKKDLE